MLDDTETAVTSTSDFGESVHDDSDNVGSDITILQKLQMMKPTPNPDPSAVFPETQNFSFHKYLQAILSYGDVSCTHSMSDTGRVFRDMAWFYTLRNRTVMFEYEGVTPYTVCAPVNSTCVSFFPPLPKSADQQQPARSTDTPTEVPATQFAKPAENADRGSLQNPDEFQVFIRKVFQMLIYKLRQTHAHIQAQPVQPTSPLGVFGSMEVIKNHTASTADELSVAIGDKVIAGIKETVDRPASESERCRVSLDTSSASVNVVQVTNTSSGEIGNVPVACLAMDKLDSAPLNLSLASSPSSLLTADAKQARLRDLTRLQEDVFEVQI
jgi:hypothetical protein